MIVRMHWTNAYGYQCLLLMIKKEVNIETVRIAGEIQGNSAWLVLNQTRTG